MLTDPDTVTLDDVVGAYRLLLGRRPDEAALLAYGDLIKRKSLSHSELAEALLTSNEYRASKSTGDAGPVAVEFGGFKVFVRRNDQDIGRAIALTETYEPYVVSAFREQVTAGMQVVDVGANIGFYTMLAAHLVGPTGKVFAFEPADKNVQLLCAGTIANHFTNVEIFPFAAGSRNELVSIDTHDNTSNCELHDLSSSPSPQTTYAVVRVLDDILSAVPRVDVVKMDVEGFEPRVLQGMTRLLKHSRPVIFTEFHPEALRRNSHVNPREYADTLFTLGDRVFHLDRDGQRYACASPEDVMTRWQLSNERFGTAGSLHLDLLITQD